MKFDESTLTKIELDGWQLSEVNRFDFIEGNVNLRKKLSSDPEAGSVGAIVIISVIIAIAAAFFVWISYRDGDRVFPPIIIAISIGLIFMSWRTMQNIVLTDKRRMCLPAYVGLIIDSQAYDRVQFHTRHRHSDIHYKKTILFKNGEDWYTILWDTDSDYYKKGELILFYCLQEQTGVEYHQCKYDKKVNYSTFEQVVVPGHEQPI